MFIKQAYEDRLKKEVKKKKKKNKNKSIFHNVFRIKKRLKV